MPAAILTSSPAFTIQPLSRELSRESLIGAEVIINPGSPEILSVEDLASQDIDVLRQALYDHSVLVIKQQNGIAPATLPKLAAIWDEKMIAMHVVGNKPISNPKNILSRTVAYRTPKCDAVSIIGNGNFEYYEGIDNLNLHHVVSLLHMWTKSKILNNP